VFEPFSSTRSLGQGDGLGLASIYGIVKQSSGYIWVQSEVGKGTTFTILFPVCAVGGTAGASALQAPSHGDAPTPHTDATILLVEGDRSVRALIADELRRRGYQVLESASAEQALEVFSDFRSRIHLLLTDAVLQSGSGPTVARRLTTLDPTMLVLYMTGLPGRLSPERVDEDRAPFIQKPFSLQTLADTIRGMLAARHDTGSL
jgi:two-component system cell cycle sensor histidine kinase/response regulator CckA